MWRSPLRQIRDPRFRRLLIPLAARSGAGRGRRGDGKRSRAPARATSSFVPTLVSLLQQPPAQGRGPRGPRRATARRSSTSLAHFLRDPEEDIWVRRHMPATLAQHSRAEVRRRACRRAGRERRLPPLQGRVGAGAAASASTPSSRSCQSRSSGSLFRKRARSTTSSPITTICSAAAALRRLAARAGPPARQMARASQSHLQAAYAPLSAGATSTRRAGRSIMATRAQRASASEYLDNILSGPLRKHG